MDISVVSKFFRADRTSSREREKAASGNEAEFTVLHNIGGKIGWVEEVGSGFLLNIDQLKVLKESGSLGEYKLSRREDGKYLINVEE